MVWVGLCPVGLVLVATRAPGVATGCAGSKQPTLCIHCYQHGSCPGTPGAVLVGNQSPPHLTGEGSPCSWGAVTWARMFTTPEVTEDRDGAVLGEQDGQGAGGEGLSQVTQVL